MVKVKVVRAVPYDGVTKGPGIQQDDRDHAIDDNIVSPGGAERNSFPMGTLAEVIMPLPVVVRVKPEEFVKPFYPVWCRESLALEDPDERTKGIIAEERGEEKANRRKSRRGKIRWSESEKEPLALMNSRLSGIWS